MAFERIMRPGRSPEENGYPGLRPGREVVDGMVIDRDVEVPLRDGVRIYVDVYRPENEEGPLPALIAFSPYGKHAGGDADLFPARAGLRPGMVSQYTKFEGPDPLFWCAQGYAVINPDTRGSWNSEGEILALGAEEGRDFYDLIEWTAAQEWSNAKVGATGVSYLAVSQWFAAAERPPHLAAINPWEGFADGYRDMYTHGGIPDKGFPVGAFNSSIGISRNDYEDVPAMVSEHPLWDEYWETKAAALERIEVPAYVVASWSDQGLHTRGTLEGFKRIGSRQKWLEVHGRRKWEYYYQRSSLEKQQAFFDHFLKGVDTDVLSWPPVLLEVRERSYVGDFREEKEWPLARTQYERLYLDPSGTLEENAPGEPGTTVYAAEDGEVSFEHTFTEVTELVGHMKLRLWVQADGSDDMDLFVEVQKLDYEGRPVEFPFFSAWFDGPVAQGWLRVSHRELDDAQSEDYQPFHTHAHEERLRPDEVVPVDIEILPSGTIFHAGDKIRLVIAGHDLHHHMSAHPETRNTGQHIIHTGGDRASFLLIPTVT